MRGIKVVEALHEPENRRLADQRLTQIRFMVAMRPKKRVNRKAVQASRPPRPRSRPLTCFPACAGAVSGQAGRLPYVGPAVLAKSRTRAGRRVPLERIGLAETGGAVAAGTSPR